MLCQTSYTTHLCIAAERQDTRNGGGDLSPKGHSSRHGQLAEAKVHPQCTDPLDRQSVRSALRRWENSRKLGEHPLAHLDIVEAQRRAAGYADTTIGRGVALRDVLRDALETLRPDAGECNYMERRWRPYIIIEKQYIEGRYPDYLTQHLGIQRSTYNHEQARALDLLTDILCEREQSCSLSQSETRSVPPPAQTPRSYDHQVPFLALPRPPYDLVGRDDLLQDMKQRLFAGDSLALNGLPGVGKTALAIELANDAQVLKHFWDGVLWIGLGRQPDVLALLGVWGVALGIPLHEMASLPTAKDRAKIIHANIGMRRMLMVIDDAWQATTALTFKLGGPNCAHLLTTRIPEVALGFGTGKTTVVRELGEHDGLTLLEQIAPWAVRARPGAARALVQAVDGLPLALVLIGRYLRKETHSDQLRRLDGALDRLRQAKVRMQLVQPQAVLEHHPDLPAKAPSSLLAVIGISDEALDKDASRALYALSVFPPKPNSFSEEAALAVSAASLETLDTLTDCGLLESSGSGRYTLHPTIADYTTIRLTDEIACEQAAYKQMVAFYVRLVETRARDYKTLEAETDNILAAFQTAFEREMPVQLVRGANTFYHFLETRGLYELAETLMKQAEQTARSVGDTDALATVLRSLGRIERNRGDYVQAEEHLLEGLSLALETGSNEKISALLQSLGVVLASRGDYAQAETYLLKALVLARQTGNLQNLSHLLDNLGGVAVACANHEQAEVYLREGLALARQIGYHQRTSFLLTNLGELAINRGDYAQAEKHLQEGLALAREIGNREGVSFLLRALGIVANKRGDYERAEAYLKMGLALAREVGLPENTSLALASLGEVAGKRGDYERAEAYLKEGLALAHQIGYRLIIGTLLQNIGAVAVARSGYALAREYLQEGLTLAREIECPRLVSGILSEWGELCLRQQELDLSSVAFCEVLEIARERGLQEWVGSALYGLARVSAAQGNIIDAHHHGQESLTVLEAIGHYKANNVTQWLAKLPAVLSLENHYCLDHDGSPNVVEP